MMENDLVRLFYIKSNHEDEYYFTSSVTPISYKDKLYVPFSGISLLSAEFNDSGDNEIILHGIFEKEGIDFDDDLVGSIVQIINYENGVGEDLVTYICTKQISDSVEFKLVCKPEVIKLNQSLLPVFSKTCRANFCDKDCKLNINDFKIEIVIDNNSGNTLFCKNISNYKNNYFSGGKLFLEYDNGKKREHIIATHLDNKIIISEAYKLSMNGMRKAYLARTCDKKIRTCCYSFNNAVNFRGEPDIPEYKAIKN